MTISLGPHAIFASEKANLFASRAPITKALDNTNTLSAARPGAIRVFRHYFENQDLSRHGVDVANEVLGALGGYVPDYVELYNETAQRLGQGLERYVDLHEEAVPVLHAAGIKVAGYSFSTGNPAAEDWIYLRDRNFGGVDAVSIHEYWGNQGFTEDHALRHRWVHRLLSGNHPPFLITETGRDRVGERENCHDELQGEPKRCGWRLQQTPADQYVRELLEYDGLIAQDPYVLGAAVFTGGPSNDWSSYESDSLTDAIIRVSVTPMLSYTDCLSNLIEDNGNFFIQMVLWQSERRARGQDPFDWQEFVVHQLAVGAPRPICEPREFRVDSPPLEAPPVDLPPSPRSRGTVPWGLVLLGAGAASVILLFSDTAKGR